MRTRNALWASKCAPVVVALSFATASQAAEEEWGFDPISIDPGEVTTLRSLGPAPVTLDTVTRRVNYADLDLRLYADVVELQTRVERMARAICDALHDSTLSTTSQNVLCVSNALKDASDQVEAAIAEADRRAGARD